MKTIRIYLMGGLGNVLFQINYGLYLQEHHGFRVRFCYYLLERNIVTRIMRWTHHDVLKSLHLLDLVALGDMRRGTIFDVVLLGISRVLARSVLCHFHVGHSDISIEQLATTRALSGYFHINVPVSRSLCEKVRLGFLDLSVRLRIEPLIQLARQSVIVHFRGGDYLASDMGTLGHDYYGQALRDYEEVCVVTNDVEGARRFFNDDGYVSRHQVLNSGSAIGDFLLLASARVLVMSNSTFSWWASELGEQSRIISPSPFFRHLHWEPTSNKRRERVSVK